MKNLKLFTDSMNTSFGGTLLKNSHAKSKRPWSPKASMHVVLKAKSGNLRAQFHVTEKLIRKQSSKHFVKIYHIEIQGDHIHLVIRTKAKQHLSNFLRSICGLIARFLNIEWLQRPFSRLVRWGREYKSLKNYMTINHYEAKGYKRYQVRFMLEMGWCDP